MGILLCSPEICMPAFDAGYGTAPRTPSCFYIQLMTKSPRPVTSDGVDDKSKTHHHLLCLLRDYASTPRGCVAEASNSLPRECIGTGPCCLHLVPLRLSCFPWLSMQAGRGPPLLATDPRLPNPPDPFSQASRAERRISKVNQASYWRFMRGKTAGLVVAVLQAQREMGSNRRKRIPHLHCTARLLWLSIFFA